MERAGAGRARGADAFPAARRFAVVCGGGSKGGTAGSRHGSCASRAGRREETEDVDGAEVIVDALFGTGFRGAPRPEAAALIERINAAGRPVVAVDVPSGVDASTGEVAGPAVRAALTVTFHGPKVGLHVARGSCTPGEVVVADIGLVELPTEHRLVGDEILRLIPLRGVRDTSTARAGARRRRCAGDDRRDLSCRRGRRSAPTRDGWRRRCPSGLAGRRDAAARSGEDHSRTSTPLGKARAVAVGPGMGRTKEAAALRERLLAEVRVPVVIDADGLFELDPERCRRAPYSRRTRASSGGCSARESGVGGRPPSRGRPRRRPLRLRLPAQGRRHADRRTGRGRAPCGRARMRWRRPGRATSSPGSWPPSSPRASSHAWPPRRPRRPTASPPRTSGQRGSGCRGLSSSDVLPGARSVSRSR